MKKREPFRFTTIYLVFIFLFLILSAKVIYLQAYRRNFFKNLAKRQHYGLFQIQGKRGKILGRNKEVLARSINYYSVFADPSLIKNKAKYAKILSRNLGISEQEIMNKLNKKNRRFV